MSTEAVQAIDNHAPRYQSLDAVRGIGALVVVAVHGFFVVRGPVDALFWGTETESDGPLQRALTCIAGELYVVGMGALLAFFALSGFVLTLLLLDTSQPSYGSFVARRVCRIYLPYLAVIAGAIVLMAFAGGYPIPEMSRWFNMSWNRPITRALLIDHALMLGLPGYNVVDNPTWTLVHEMRYALVFPAIFWIVKKTHAAVSLAGSLALSLGTTFVLNHVGPVWGVDSFRYLFLFVAGSVLAIHRHEVVAKYRALSASARIAIGCASLVLINAGILAYSHDQLVHRMGMTAPELGAPILIAALIGSKKVGAMLSNRPVLWLGRVSYSLYLSHVVLLLILIRVLHGVIPLWLILTAYVPLALSLAGFLNRILEQPANHLGHRWAAQIDPKPTRVKFQSADVAP